MGISNSELKDDLIRDGCMEQDGRPIKCPHCGKNDFRARRMPIIGLAIVVCNNGDCLRDICAYDWDHYKSDWGIREI